MQKPRNNDFSRPPFAKINLLICHARSKMSNFIKQTSFSIDYAPAAITKWQLSHLGLQLVYINQPSPMVNGYFAVATEIDNNLGCPHTLEHLVFMGSKKYPYKGLLDLVGNRLFSTTNAWTLVDQTVYTLTLAGWHGFRLLLPVYLDHLLNPTLTQDACLTEVYHIDGAGKEKGVVFSEMQGIENQNWFVTFLQMQQKLYPPELGYSLETGGLMEELRRLTNDQIRDFHRSMYRPDNLCVIVTGLVDEAELLETMEAFDAELPPQAQPPLPRPFYDLKASAMTPLTETTVHTVEFPDKDELMGELLMLWIGPPAPDTLVNVALDIAGAYLSELPILVLNKYLIEVENPWATDIDYTTDDYLRTTLNFTVNGVPTAKLDALDGEIKAILRQQTDPAQFDLAYMRQVLENQRLKFILLTEKLPLLFSNIAISEFIYGDGTGADLPRWTKDLAEYDELATWTSQQWCAVIDKYFCQNHSLTILGSPLARLNKQLRAADKARAKAIQVEYGPEGLKELQAKLDEAQAVNSAPIPSELITLFPKPDPAQIEFINTSSYLGGTHEGVIDPKKNDYVTGTNLADEITEASTRHPGLPFIHFEHYKLQFTTINLVMSLTAIQDLRLLSYMLVIEEIFTMSVERNGEYLPFNEVISQINDDLIEFQLDNGFENSFLELINIKIKFETTKYSEAISWLKCITQLVVFEALRIKVIVEKLINLLADKKRNGELMMYSSKFRNMFNDGLLRRAQDPVHTESFFRALHAQLEQPDGFDSVKKDLEALVSQLFALDNMKIFIVGNVEALNEPVQLWVPFVDGFKVEAEQELLRLSLKESALLKHEANGSHQNGKSRSSVPTHPVPFSKMPRLYQFKSSLGQECSRQAFLVLCPAADLTHFISHTPMPTDYFDEDQYKIALTLEILATVEGPFWRGIRGTGLAYGALIRRNMETGLLGFSIYRGSDAIQAWQVAKQIVDSFALGKETIDDIAIENAISTMVNELANGVENCYDAATCKIIDNLFKRRGPHYDRFFLQQLNRLTAADIVYALNKYFVPLFAAEHLVIFTLIPPEKQQEFTEFFEAQGYEVNVERIELDAISEANHLDCSSCDEDYEECDSDCSTCNEDSEFDSEDESDLADETSDLDFGKKPDLNGSNGHHHITDEAKRKESEKLKPFKH